MKTIGILLLTGFLGLGFYNKQHNTDILVEYLYTTQTAKKAVVDVSPAPFIDKSELKLTRPDEKKVNQKPTHNVKIAENGIVFKEGNSKQDPRVLAYVNSHIEYALECERKFGVPAELALAQALVESGLSNANINTVANNHHGFLQFDKNGPYVLYQVAPKYGTRKWIKFKNVQASYDAYGAKVSTDMKKLGVKEITIDEIVKTNYSGKKKGPDYEYAGKAKHYLNTYELKNYVSDYKRLKH